MTADMTAWNSQAIERFKALLNVREISDQTSDEGLDGDSDDTKLKRVAVARNRHPQDVRAVHETLTALAFDGYQDWAEQDDDEWFRNCLGQVFDDTQSHVLITGLQNCGLIDLTTNIEMMAGPYRTEWQRAADSEASEAARGGAKVTAEGLLPGENTESWKYSRTPGTRYYIYHQGQYLYSDDKDAPLAGWASAQVRDDQAAARATEWESGSGIYYTAYDEPALVGGVTHVFGQSKDGPWVLTRSQAEELLDAGHQDKPGVSGAGDAIEPYFDTGHFTRYRNDAYEYGESRDAATWHPTYQQLLDAIATRGGREQAKPADDAFAAASESDEEWGAALSALTESDESELTF